MLFTLIFQASSTQRKNQIEYRKFKLKSNSGMEVTCKCIQCRNNMYIKHTRIRKVLHILHKSGSKGRQEHYHLYICCVYSRCKVVLLSFFSSIIMQQGSLPCFCKIDRSILDQGGVLWNLFFQFQLVTTYMYMYVPSFQDILEGLECRQPLSQFKQILALNSNNQTWLCQVHPEHQCMLWSLAVLELGKLLMIIFYWKSSTLL